MRVLTTTTANICSMGSLARSFIDSVIPDTTPSPALSVAPAFFLVTSLLVEQQKYKGYIH